MKNNKGFTIRTKHKRFILRKKHKGFTLVELIAVIVVIVILAAIALPRIGDMQSAAGDAQAKATAATINEAVQRAIVEGSLTSGNFSSYTSVLEANSPMTGVPYVLASDLNGVTIAPGVFPAFTVTVTPLTYSAAK